MTPPMQSQQEPTLDIPSLQKDAFGEIAVLSRACPSCAEPNAETPQNLYSLGVWAIKTCRTCAFTYISVAPAYEALYEQMAWEKSSKIEEQRRMATRGFQQRLSKGARWRLHWFPRKKMPDLLGRYAQPGNVVDLGCGDGGPLGGLPASFIPYGIEVSRQAAAAADARFKARGGGVINAPCLEGLREFRSAFFTAATLRSYLEHELHPADVLRELHRTLKPGGVVIVKVPNYASLNRRVMGRRWCGFRHPDHLNYFTPNTLLSMAQNCGFDTWFGATWRLPTSDNMYAILTRR